MELDANTKLRRFCVLGSFNPVYVHSQKPLDVSNTFTELQELCKALDDTAFVSIVGDLLKECSLVRRDETLYVYAVYFCTDLDINWKTNVRKAFPALIQTADDLFLFCKYAMAVQKKLNHKGFSRTMRKAITAWYELQTPEALKEIWTNNFGNHGFTHRNLMRLCFISDGTIGSKEVGKLIFKTKKKSSIAKDIAVKTATATSIPVPESQQNGTVEGESQLKTVVEGGKNGTVEGESQLKTVVEGGKNISNADEPLSPSAAISARKRLYLTRNKKEALSIIRQFKLRYHQVPKHFRSYAPIMELLIPTMSYLQLLKSWHDIARFRHFANPEIMKLCENVLNNKRTLHKSNIHPVVFLLQRQKLEMRNINVEMSTKRAETLQLPYFERLYTESFGQNIGTGLRMHITLNLQESYRKKFLKNYHNLSFYEASIALAFGYFKKECDVDVFYWVEDKMKLQQIPWTRQMDIAEAVACCDNILNVKNSQRLVTPVLQALGAKNVYDVFIAIVPTGGRGNPRKVSELLSLFIDKYRQSKNPKAKYIIIDLLRHRRSMNYSSTRNENILEICGLDEHTTKLVTDFALNRFG